MSTEYQYFTGFFDLTFDKAVPLRDLFINKYSIEDYLIAYEEYNAEGKYKPHIHWIIKGTPLQKTNMVQYVVKLYNLKTTSQGGVRRYGTLKRPIKNLERLRIYCSKDKNVLSNLPKEELDRLAELSFKKKETDIKKNLLEHLDTHYKKLEGTTLMNYQPFEIQRLFTDRYICEDIIAYLKENKIHLRKSLLLSYLIYIRTYSNSPNIKYTNSQLYHLLLGGLAQDDD
jgi:hypothetical protein